ncbi:MAG: hypothetical protein AAF542_21750 [Pseudomonadota bacterium]
MSNGNKKPVLNINDGTVSASIWRNETEDGKVYFNATVKNAYKGNDENWHDTNSYNNDQLLKLARVANKAYDAALELRANDQSDD